jgi:hypothetical protein
LALVGVCWLLLSAVAAEPLVSLAVLPFGNLSDYRGRLLDRRAAAAVSAEAPAAWGPASLTSALQALEDLSVPLPLETADVQRVCARLQAAAAATGVVKQVKVQGQGAEVTLVLEVTEPLSGEVVGRAQGVGKFSTREPLPVEARVEEALRRAAQAAWAGLGTPPVVVGKTTVATAGRWSVQLAGPARLAPQAVVLLYPPEVSPAALPLAGAVVTTVAAGVAQLRLIGGQETVPAGAVAIAIGHTHE